MSVILVCKYTVKFTTFFKGLQLFLTQNANGSVMNY